MGIIDSVVASRQMKIVRAIIIAAIACMVFFIPKMAYAVDVTMGSNGNLIFDPSDVTITAGETVHFVNSMLPPHNIIVEGRADLSRESLMFNPGESQDILFADAGDYTFFCGPHQGAGMTGIIHVN